ncbi:hypothetical protein F5Y05DRAFT_272575 [Hypoxylon sp. FL0543]|nr:hypothetical protein F5Y05DRAFT_272575 [Hypoxylon sp. FL0543]
MAWQTLKWASARWSVSRCLLFARLLQVCGTLVTAVMNGFLLVYINVNDLGLATSMFCLEMMVCIAFIYSAVVLLFQHAGNPHRRSRTPLIAAFVAGDLVFNGMMIAVITVLAGTGLPANCHGLTKSNIDEDDPHDKPPEGYDTIGFGDGNIKGQLDRYCSLEQGFYFIAAGLVFTYVLTVTLGVLRIFEQRWNHGRKDPIFASTDDLYQLNDMRPKIRSPRPNRDPDGIVPSSEGIITPTSRPNPSFHTQGIRSSGDLHRNRPFLEQSHPQSQPVPISPVSAASPTSQVSPISPVAHQHGQFIPAPGVLDTSMGGLMIDHSRNLDAEAAMVTDGYRHQVAPGMSSLPPYAPGQSRGQFMDGHGDESNEMRLSDYVKGETRAQRMKDSGMGL